MTATPEQLEAIEKIVTSSSHRTHAALVEVVKNPGVVLKDFRHHTPDSGESIYFRLERKDGGWRAQMGRVAMIERCPIEIYDSGRRRNSRISMKRLQELAP
jgi:hypothetical protein